jgi:hypothetical protein
MSKVATWRRLLHPQSAMPSRADLQFRRANLRGEIFPKSEALYYLKRLSKEKAVIMVVLVSTKGETAFNPTESHFFFSRGRWLLLNVCAHGQGLPWLISKHQVHIQMKIS